MFPALLQDAHPPISSSYGFQLIHSEVPAQEDAAQEGFKNRQVFVFKKL